VHGNKEKVPKSFPLGRREIYTIKLGFPL
jgi:hypothetical protein